MRIFGKVVGTIYILCGITLVIFFLTVWANPELINTTEQLLNENITTTGGIAIGIVILGVIYIVNWFEYINKTRNVSFDNPGGKVKISLKAIEDSITALISREVEGIKSLRVKNYVSPKGLETRIYLKLISGLNIPETCSTIQEITKNYLQDTVGVERVSNIEINVTNISGGEFLSETTPEKIKEEEEEEHES